MPTKTLSKDMILLHTNSNDIYTKFLGLPEFPTKNISSPFTTDNNPSLKLYTNGTFKCNSSGRQGDVWQFVADFKNLDCKTQMKQVLETIAREMSLELQLTNTYQNNNLLPKSVANNTIDAKNNNNCNTKNSTIATTTIPKKLEIVTRDFTDLDLNYWQNLGVEKVLLQKYNCNSISSYNWTGKNTIYTKKEAVAFVWELEKSFKLYIPNQLNIGVEKNVLPPFKTGIFGLEQLGIDKLKNILICEGEKDVVVASSRGFNAITFGSGSAYPKKEQIQLLQDKCNKLFVCYDSDDTGITGMSNLVKSYKDIIAIYLPKNENIKGFDITDYFQSHSAQDFQKIMDLAEKNKVSDTINVEENENTDLTIFHKVEIYLTKHYDLRLDVIANEIEISKKDENVWNELNDDHLYVEMQKKHIKISIGNLRSILLSDFVPKFNPIRNYFESLPTWDKKTDYIKQFLNYVELEPGEDVQQFVYQFKKWCVRAVKCSTIDGYYNKQAFVLSDDAKGQNIGKTTFIRYLIPKALNKYYCENLPEDKDALKRLGQNFIINLDELATLSKTDINKLKTMFSSDSIKTRLPYGKKDVIISRVANFIGSTNQSTFLVDETGSVRWLCFIIKKINFKYSTEFNIDNLWSQATALSHDENFKEVMTPEDIKFNEIRNDKFQILSTEREIIPRFFEVPKKFDNPEHLTATDILNYISLWTSNGLRLNSNSIGKALPKCGFEKKKHKDIYGYWVIKKPIQN
jgi:predicted P-loop ATPase